MGGGGDEEEEGRSLPARDRSEPAPSAATGANPPGDGTASAFLAPPRGLGSFSAGSHPRSKSHDQADVVVKSGERLMQRARESAGARLAASPPPRVENSSASSTGLENSGGGEGGEESPGGGDEMKNRNKSAHNILEEESNESGRKSENRKRTTHFREMDDGEVQCRIPIIMYESDKAQQDMTMFGLMQSTRFKVKQVYSTGSDPLQRGWTRGGETYHWIPRKNNLDGGVGEGVVGRG